MYNKIKCNKLANWYNYCGFFMFCWPSILLHAVKRNAFSSTQFSSRFLFLILFVCSILKQSDVELGGKMLWHVLQSCCSIFLEEIKGGEFTC